MRRAKNGRVFKGVGSCCKGAHRVVIFVMTIVVVVPGWQDAFSLRIHRSTCTSTNEPTSISRPICRIPLHRSCIPRLCASASRDFLSSLFFFFIIDRNIFIFRCTLHSRTMVALFIPLLASCALLSLTTIFSPFTLRYSLRRNTYIAREG